MRPLPVLLLLGLLRLAPGRAQLKGGSSANANANIAASEAQLEIEVRPFGHV